MYATQLLEKEHSGCHALLRDDKVLSESVKFTDLLIRSNKIRKTRQMLLSSYHFSSVCFRWMICLECSGYFLRYLEAWIQFQVYLSRLALFLCFFLGYLVWYIFHFLSFLSFAKHYMACHDAACYGWRNSLSQTGGRCSKQQEGLCPNLHLVQIICVCHGNRQLIVLECWLLVPPTGGEKGRGWFAGTGNFTNVAHLELLICLSES